MAALLRLLLVLLGCSGCTGLALGLNAAGAPTHVGSGSLAVDDRTETTFVLSTHTTARGVERRLHGVPADGEAALVHTSLNELDQRVLFPHTGVLLMSEVKNGGERLTLFDRGTFSEKRSATVRSHYWGTRMSPTGKWIAVADNDDDALPIHVIDASSLEVRPIPHAGDWLEATWSTERDLLVAAIFEEGEAPSVRIATWAMDAVNERQFATDTTGAWASPELDITIDGKVSDGCLSFTWISTSPDGRWAAVPLRDVQSAGYELVLVDLMTRTHRIVDHAKGPVGFTDDSQTIVSYAGEGAAPAGAGSCAKGRRQNPEVHAPIGPEHIVLIDVTSLHQRRAEVPGLEHFNFHVLDTSVIVAPLGTAKTNMFIFDVREPERGSVVDSAGAQLTEFIQRPLDHDVWLVSDGLLHRIDLTRRQIELYDLGFAATHVNHLPQRDLLVLDERKPGASTIPVGLLFWDPDERRITRRVALPP